MSWKTGLTHRIKTFIRVNDFALIALRKAVISFKGRKYFINFILLLRHFFILFIYWYFFSFVYSKMILWIFNPGAGVSSEIIFACVVKKKCLFNVIHFYENIMSILFLKSDDLASLLTKYWYFLLVAARFSRREQCLQEQYLTTEINIIYNIYVKRYENVYIFFEIPL